MEYLFSIFILFILLPLALAWKSMAPWVPTRKRDIERLIHILDLKSRDTFFEIGCGDGRVSRAVAKAFPQSRVVWLELAYPVWIVAKVLWFFWGTKNCSVKLWNAFKQNFSDYDVIYVYGMPDKMWAKIVPKFMQEAKKGAKLYSYVFSIPEEFKENVISYGGEGEARIHVLAKK